MKKVLLVMLLSVLMIPMLTGCGLQGLWNGGETEHNEPIDDVNGGENDYYDDTGDKGEDTGDKGEDTGDEGENHDDADELNYPIRGTVIGNIYENKFASLTFNKPDAWTYAGDAEIAGLTGIGVDMLVESGLSFNEEMLELQSVYDMLVSDPVTGSGVFVMFENLSVVKGAANMSVQDYIEVVKAQLEQVNGMDYYSFVEAEPCTISGETYTGFVATANLEDILVDLRYCVRKVGDYMISIAFMFESGDDINEILACFS